VPRMTVAQKRPRRVLANRGQYDARVA
jgi:hypothetical protein